MKMLHYRGLGKKRPNNSTPLKKSRRFAEVNSMIFKGSPINHQYITFRRFDTLIDFKSTKTFCMANHFIDTTLYRSVKFGLLSRVDADISNFENHFKLLVSRDS